VGGWDRLYLTRAQLPQLISEPWFDKSWKPGDILTRKPLVRSLPVILELTVAFDGLAIREVGHGDGGSVGVGVDGIACECRRRHKQTALTERNLSLRSAAKDEG
jgi:hypothetical protein